MCFLITFTVGCIVTYFVLRWLGKVNLPSFEKFIPRKEGIVSQIKDEKENLYARQVNLKQDEKELNQEISEFEKLTNLKVE